MSDNRCHLEEKYTWDLTTIFATDADWETEYESIVQDLKKASSFAGHLLDSAKNLLEATELYMSLMRRLEKIYVYASMKNDQDTTVGLYQEYNAKASNLYSQLSEAFAYFEPEFMALEAEKPIAVPTSRIFLGCKVCNKNRKYATTSCWIIGIFSLRAKTSSSAKCPVLSLRCVRM